MGNDCPDCYGKPTHTTEKECAVCEYAKSCALYASWKDEPAQAVSFECQENALELNRSGSPAGCHKDIRTTVTISELAEFAGLLFRMDDYTLLILREVIANGASSIAELAQAMGVRRQAMHAKILRTLRRFPELSDIFAALMPRLSVARRRYMKKQTRKRKKGNTK